MFYQVRVFDRKGKLKDTIENQELSEDFWKKFNSDETGSLRKSALWKSNSSRMIKINKNHRILDQQPVS